MEVVAVRKGYGALLGWFVRGIGGCTLAYTSENCPWALQSNDGILHSTFFFSYEAYKPCRLL